MTSKFMKVTLYDGVVGFVPGVNCADGDVQTLNIETLFKRGDVRGIVRVACLGCVLIVYARRLNAVSYVHNVIK